MESDLEAALHDLENRLCDVIEPNYGLVDHLLSLGLIDRRQKDELNCKQIATHKKNAKLLKIIRKNKKTNEEFEKLFVALKRSSQQHVVNFIHSRGVRDAQYGKDWPLNRDHVDQISCNEPALVENMEVCDKLLADLAAKHCITSRQKSTLQETNSLEKKASMLIDFLTRKSEAEFEMFLEALTASNQKHVAEMFCAEGVIVPTDSTLEPAECGPKTEERIADNFKLLVENSPASEAGLTDELVAQYNTLTERLKPLGISLVGIKKQDSVGTYFSCRTLPGLVRLRSLYLGGQLQRLLEQLFASLLMGSHQRIRIMKLDWKEQDFNKSVEYFLAVNIRRSEACDFSGFRNLATPLNLSMLPRSRVVSILKKAVSLMLTDNSRTDSRELVESMQMLASVCCKFRQICRKVCPSTVSRHRSQQQRHALVSAGVDAKLTALHITSGTHGSESSEGDQTRDSSVSYRCRTHTEERVELYCTACSQLICAVCCVERHSHHSFSEIDQLSPIFRTQLQADIDDVLSGITHFQHRKLQLEEQKTRLVENVEYAASQLSTANQCLADRITNDVVSLRDGLVAFERQNSQEIRSLELQAEEHVTTASQFVDQCRVLKATASPLEIVSQYKRFHDTAVGLQKFRLRQNSKIDVRVSFAASLLSADASAPGRDNFVGQLVFGDQSPTVRGVRSEPQLAASSRYAIQTFPGSASADMEIARCRSQLTHTTEQLEKSVEREAETWKRLEEANAKIAELERRLSACGSKVEYGTSEGVESEEEQQESSEISRQLSSETGEVRVIECKDEVLAMTSLGNELYVATKNATDLSVYELTTYFRLARHLAVDYLSVVSDMASCTRYSCVYVASFDTGLVHKIRFDQITNWAVRDHPSGISVTPTAQEVLVTCPATRRLLIFNTSGGLVRTISLQPEITNPVHAVQLTTGNYFMCDVGQDKHRIAEVDPRGHLLPRRPRSTSFLPSYSTNYRMFNQFVQPLHHAVSRGDGSVFVADGAGRKVLLVDSSLSQSVVLLSSEDVDDEDFCPRRLSLDEDNELLFVSDRDRVLICDASARSLSSSESSTAVAAAATSKKSKHDFLSKLKRGLSPKVTK